MFTNAEMIRLIMEEKGITLYDIHKRFTERLLVSGLSEYLKDTLNSQGEDGELLHQPKFIGGSPMAHILRLSPSR